MYVNVNPYLGLDSLVKELKLKPADVAADAALTDELNQAIDRASRWVDEYTRRDYVFHDFTVAPMEFDQFSDNVFGLQIFFPNLPIVGLTKLLLGKSADPACATELELNVDYWFDANRIYLLESSRMFIQNVDIPHDGGGLKRGGRGWNLFRPGRILFVYGTSGFVQRRTYQMTASGDSSDRVSGWIINSYSQPGTLYYTLNNTTGFTVKLYADAGLTQLVSQFIGNDLTGATKIVLTEQNGSGINGSFFVGVLTGDIVVTDTLTLTPNQPTPIDTASLPLALTPRIVEATRLVAAAFSGHNRKEVVGLDGQKSDIADRAIPKTVYELLGRRAPILI